MQTLLLEDEPLAARRTRGYLERYGQGLAEAGWCQSVADARDWLEAHGDPDLILSDIELLDGNVFGLFDARAVTCPVVFATAYDQFLLRAFEANGVGYLLKPFTFEQFAAAIDKVRALTGSAEPRPPGRQPVSSLDAAAVATLQAALARQHTHYRSRFTARRASGITLLPAEEVALLLSEDKVVFAVDAAGGRHPLGQTLNALEAELDPAEWFRVNRGQLVHLAFIERLAPYGRDRLAVHLRGLKVPAVASRERTPALRRWVGA